MNVGRSAPRYQIIASIYPQSRNLQSSLSEYFIVIVHLCHRVLKFTKRSTVGQFVSSLSDSDIKTAQSDLEVWANSIKEEVNLMMSRTVEDEAQENSRLRDVLTRSSEKTSHRQRLKMNLHVLDSCSTYDYETTWKQIRKLGNATIFNQAAEYRNWKTGADSSTLICTGKLGSGKSVSMANAVDDLNLHVQDKNIAVAYFFCRHDLPDSLKAQTVIGSLARQLLRLLPDLSMAAELLGETTPWLDAEKISSLLQRALPPKCKAYFILDGLDELVDIDRHTLIEQLRKLQETFTLLLCVSFRLEADNALRLKLEEFTAPSIISIPENNPDIKEFINAELESCIRSGKLEIGDPPLVLEIQDALWEGAQGMFLWVVLQIKSLCAEKTDEAIRQALADLPKDLAETFSRILRRSEDLRSPYQKRILQLVTVARRPLTGEELQEALSVVPGNKAWNPERLLNNLYSTLACCGSLITVDEEELTVRLVHHSVKNFLLSGSHDSTGIPFTTDSAHEKMAEIIITYLSYGVFETKLSTQVVPQIMTRSVPSRIICSILDSPSNTRKRLALKLLKSSRQPNYDIGKSLAGESKYFKSRSIDGFYFYSYAKSYWFQHTGPISMQKPVILNLLLKLLKEEVVDIHEIDEYGRTPLLWAVAQRHEAIVNLLLANDHVDANSKDRDGQTPFWWALKNGDEIILKSLLDSTKVDVNLKDKDDQTPLFWASKNGFSNGVKLLLDNSRVDINSKEKDGQTALLCAAASGLGVIVKLFLDSSRILADDYHNQRALLFAIANGHEAVVKMLLDSGKFDVNAKDMNSDTALSLAIEEKHEGIVKLLLNSSKINVNLASRNGYTPLLHAVEKGDEAIVKLLLNSGKIDINLPDKNGYTPLFYAIKTEDESIVKLLLDNGKINVGPMYKSNVTPLFYAIGRQNKAIIKLLLDSSKIDVNLASRNGYTPLLFAVEKGDEAIVKLLLNSGKIDINLADKYGDTPLLHAIENKNESIVKLLLDNGKIDVNLANKSGVTPLLYAIKRQNKAIVKLLLDNSKIDINLVDRGGYIPLWHAIEQGNEFVVKLLLDNGKIDVNLANKDDYCPLFHAMWKGNKYIVKLLLDSGKIDVNLVNRDDYTPLLYATRIGDEFIVKLLLNSSKIDVNSRDRNGRTPLSHAIERGNKAIVKLLQSHSGVLR